MRAFETTSTGIIVPRPPLVLDAAYVRRLNALASAELHGASRLARLLRREAAPAAVLPSDRMPADVDNFGTDVTYRDEEVGAAYTVTLVMPRETDIHRGRASVLTPVGTALIGRSEGAVVDCEFPAGRMRQLTVLRVRPAAPRRLADLAPDAAQRALA
jgi:regulator of nucleoside diphosphate kinase